MGPSDLPGETQVVVQWRFTGSDVDPYFVAEDRIADAGGDLYWEDGNDIGGGCFNVYLYTANVPETLDRLIELERAGDIPGDMRIGVAVYTDASRADWTHRPAYPANLSSFSIA